VVASAPLDWTHSQVLPVFSCSAICLGLTTHYLGGWVERVGPRLAGTVGSVFWSLGLITTGVGVHLHQLPLVYLGYSVFGGVGWGLMYLCPVTSVMKWFPDRRGLATGIALSAFGMGAAVAPAIIQTLMDAFAVAPEYVGPVLGTESYVVELKTLTDGSLAVAETSPIGNPGDAVVVATAGDTSTVSNISTGAGAYLLGTGDTGTAKSLVTLGLGYGVIGLLGSRFMILPHRCWTPDGPFRLQEEHKAKDAGRLSTKNPIDFGLPTSYVTSSTTQFPLLWLTVFGNATGGLALLSSSKLMITDIWACLDPSTITTSFTTGYVSSLGVGMAIGRLGWSTMSDMLGRQNTYAIFGLGIPIMGLAPYLTHAAANISIGESTALLTGNTTTNSITTLLMAFYGGSVLAITFYGGIFSTLPAYIADLFGQKHAGAIHGKFLTAWAASAVVGPIGCV
jgi:MFS family permease